LHVLQALREPDSQALGVGWRDVAQDAPALFRDVSARVTGRAEHVMIEHARHASRTGAGSARRLRMACRRLSIRRAADLGPRPPRAPVVDQQVKRLE